MILRRSIVLSFLGGVAVATGVLAWLRTNEEQKASTSEMAGQGSYLKGDRAKGVTQRSIDHAGEANDALVRFEESGNRAQLSDILSRWAAHDGAAAAAWAEATLSDEDLPVLLHDLLAVWITHDQDGVIQWYRDGLDQDGKHRAKVASVSGRHTLPELLVSWLAMLNPARSAKFMMEDLYKGESQHLFYSEPTRDLPAALRTSAQFREVCEALVPYYERYGHHMGETKAVLSAWREVDPEGAARFIEEYPVPDQKPLGKTERPPTESEPETVVERADRLLAEVDAESADYRSALRNILKKWPEQDLVEARSWLEQRGRSEETFDARSDLAARSVSHNPQDALELLDPLPPGGALERSLEHVIESWAGSSPEAVLDFLRAQEASWSAERIIRLRELALTSGEKKR